MATDNESAKLLRQQSAAKSNQQFIRRVSLNVLQYISPLIDVAMDYGDGFQKAPAPTEEKTLKNPTDVLDLSEMHFQFSVLNQDDQAPTNCTIRVYNLAASTVQRLLKYPNSKVVLQAGYGSSFGVIFSGDIKQFRVGKLNQTDTYVDILAADGDYAYNSGVCNATLSAQQNTPAGQLRAINDSLTPHGVQIPQPKIAGEQLGGIIVGRGKTLIGMSRAQLQDYCNTHQKTWSIQNGVVQIIDLDGYLPGEAVVLTSATGLIGIPEQTQDGIIARCLINPKLFIGGRVQINNASINQTLSAIPVAVDGSQLAFDVFGKGANQVFASVVTDGFYRVYICEHTGDTRGNEWYSDITCLAIDSSAGNLVKVGF